MFHWFDTITNTRGDSLSNWQVECINLTTGAVVPIFADENSTPIASVSGFANRAVTDENGNYDFFVPSGTYSLRIYNPSGVLQRTQRYLPMYGADAANTANLADTGTGKGAFLVGHIAAGTGATARTVQDKLRETVSVKDFGAVGDGVADDTVAIQAAVDANPGGLIFFPPGTYKINTRIVITDDNTVIDLGNAVIDATAFTGWTSSPGSNWDSGRYRSVFEFRGTVKTAITAAANIAANANTITVSSAAGLAIGDIIDIESDGELWYTEGSNTWNKRETNEITAISGSTITLAYRTKFAYDATGHTVNILPYTPIRNCHIRGGRSFGGGVRGVLLNGFGPCFVAFEGFKDCSASPTYVEGFQNSIATFHYGIGAVFKGGTMRGLAEDYTTPIVEDQNSGFYGVWFLRGRDAYFSAERAYRLRHVQDGAEWDSCQIEMKTAPQGGHRQPYGSHGGCDNFRFFACDYDGPLTAMLWRGFSVEVLNCRWRCLASTSNGFTDATGNNSDLPRRYVFTGNNIRASRHAILIDANQLESLSITGPNRLENAIELGYPAVLVNRAKIDRTRIGDGSEFITLDTNAIFFQTNALEDGNVIEMDGAVLKGWTGSGLRLNTVAAGVVVTNGNNVFQPNGGTNNILYSAGSIGNTGRTLSGSDANGNWIRFADGTQIVTRRITSAPTTTTAYTYPQTFIAAPVLSLAFERGTDGDFADIAVRANSTTGYSLQSSAFPAGHSVLVTAIGRWF